MTDEERRKLDYINRELNRNDREPEDIRFLEQVRKEILSRSGNRPPETC